MHRELLMKMMKDTGGRGRARGKHLVYFLFCITLGSGKLRQPSLPPWAVSILWLCYLGGIPPSNPQSVLRHIRELCRNESGSLLPGWPITSPAHHRGSYSKGFQSFLPPSFRSGVVTGPTSSAWPLPPIFSHSSQTSCTFPLYLFPQCNTSSFLSTHLASYSILPSLNNARFLSEDG